MQKVNESMGQMQQYLKRGQLIREQFYPGNNYIADTMESIQQSVSRFP